LDRRIEGEGIDVRAQVSVWTIDGDHLESVSVADPRDAGHWVRVLAGPEGSDGEESFDVLVCTPTWLGREVDGRHLLVVETWEPARVRHLVTQLFEKETADDWPRLATRLSRHGSWEFDGYRP
jgi:Immunity protein 8